MREALHVQLGSAVDTPTMRAIVHHRYGPLEGLKVREIAKPVVADDEVLVRIRAAGLQIGDVFGVRGSPWAMRAVTGLFRPKIGVPGWDFAGRVEAVGVNVTRFRRGDDVFGACNGSCAEYTSTHQDRLAHKPGSLTYEQAAAVPTSAVAALHALRDVGKLQTGQKVLINGASGGVGTFAVQIAKSLGAEVTGVCSTANIALVHSLGADRVIDYTRQDFTEPSARDGARFDLILDNVENRPLSAVRRALAPEGTLLCNSGTGAHGLRMMLRLVAPLVISPFVRQNLRRFVSAPKHDDLFVLRGLIDSGKVMPVIDKNYPLGETFVALGYIEAGHARGKVVVTVS